MAKTAKSTKRSTPVKKSRFKINFNSKKTQFIAVILLVAVMGGGWFTYRSFAALPRWTLNGHELKVQTKHNDCVVNKTRDPAKNNSPVTMVGCKDNPKTNATLLTDPIQPKPSSFYSWPHGHYQACFTVKGKGNIIITTYTSRNSQTGVQYNINHSDYKQYCGNRSIDGDGSSNLPGFRCSIGDSFCGFGAQPYGQIYIYQGSLVSIASSEVRLRYTSPTGKYN